MIHEALHLVQTKHSRLLKDLRGAITSARFLTALRASIVPPFVVVFAFVFAAAFVAFALVFALVVIAPSLTLIDRHSKQLIDVYLAPPRAFPAQRSHRALTRRQHRRRLRVHLRPHLLAIQPIDHEFVPQRQRDRPRALSRDHRSREPREQRARGVPHRLARLRRRRLRRAAAADRAFPPRAGRARRARRRPRVRERRRERRRPSRVGHRGRRRGRAAPPRAHRRASRSRASAGASTLRGCALSVRANSERLWSVGRAGSATAARARAVSSRRATSRDGCVLDERARATRAR